MTNKNKVRFFTEYILLSVLIVSLISCLDVGSNPDPHSPEIATPDSSVILKTVLVIAEYPHDPEAFTQGLLFENDFLFESTGKYGESTLRKVDLETGDILQIMELDSSFFGEGLTLCDSQLIQLTWLANTAFIYDIESFEKLGEYSYETQGWGICFDGTDFIMSDGSSFLYFRDRFSFELIKSIQVTLWNQPLVRINELEYVDGYIYANIWLSDQIVEINPETGRVTSIVDAAGLLSRDGYFQPGVLNGIAWYPPGETFLITGKYWPTLFEVEFIPLEK